MTNKEYREAEGVSRSELWKIKQSPLHFKYAQENPPEPTPALIFGQAVHKYILEPESFYEEFAVLPAYDRRTAKGKEIYANFITQSEGKTVIKCEEMETILKMKKAIDAYPLAKELLTGSHEESFFWTDQDTGEKCKCRTDCRTEYMGNPYIVDYKTTSSAADGEFERDCRKYGYKFQAGFYTEGVFQATMEPHGFAFVAQEKTAPYAVRVCICTPEFIQEGYDQFRELLGIYHDCKKSENWYGYEGPMNVPSELTGEFD